MRAIPIIKRKETDDDGDLLEAVVWKVASSIQHPKGVRYRMAFIPIGHKQPAVLYDNHHPKGHHKHIDRKESAYSFSGIEQLILDFERDVFHWKRRRDS